MAQCLRPAQNELRTPTSSVGPVLFHPDYTVGSGVTPDLLTLGTQKSKGARGLGVAAFTAGGELHPALRTLQAFDLRGEK